MNQNTSPKELQQVRMLWIVFLSTICMFTALPFVVVRDPVALDPLSRNPTLVVLQCIGIVVALASFVLRRTTLNPKFPMDLPGAWSKWLRFHIFSFSLNESVALFGLVCAMLARSPSVCLSFSAMALLLHLQMFPKDPRG